MSRGAATRAAVGAVVASLVLVVAPAAAFADPAGPTDYESEVTGLDPEVASIDVEIVGGDSFVLLDVEEGVEVIVLGYRGEPYLWFDADGVVWENRRSPATYENTERYGVDELPDRADHTADPEWHRVAGGGSWAWHDHRAHRMEPYPPVNVGRGEQVLDAVVPLVVDGEEVDVRVTSTWMPAPSLVPTVAGLVAGAMLVAALRRRVAIALLVVAGAALTMGAVQFLSLPAATKPLWIWWAAPLVALLTALFAAVRPTATLLTSGAMLVAGAQLLVWSLERRHGLVRAIIPTDAPFWTDRLVTAAALAVGALATVVVLAGVVRTLMRLPGPARSGPPVRPHPAAPGAPGR